MEKLGHIPAGTCKAIRKGQGHADLADDLQTLDSLLSARLSQVAALQSLGSADAPTIAVDDCARLSHVGSTLKLRLTQPEAVGPWHTALIGLLSLLFRSYDTAITAVHYHLKREGHRRVERDFPMFLGLRRPSSTPSDAPSAPSPPTP